VEARLSAALETGSGAHPATCTMGSRFQVPFLGVKWLGHVVDCAPPLGLHGRLRVNLTSHAAISMTIW
jgi:hypothetical protein